MNLPTYVFLQQQNSLRFDSKINVSPQRLRLLYVLRWWFYCCLCIVCCCSQCLWCSVFDPCFVMQYFVTFLGLKSSHWERAGCLIFIVCYCCLHLPHDGLWRVIVAFLGHTHLLFVVNLFMIFLIFIACTSLQHNNLIRKWLVILPF